MTTGIQPEQIELVVLYAGGLTLLVLGALMHGAIRGISAKVKKWRNFSLR